MALTTMGLIQECLSQKRIAMVGVSRNEKDFSRLLWKDLKAHGFEISLVNPATDTIDDVKCYARVQDINTKVDWALIMTASEITEQIVRDCKEAGINRVWLHRGGGQGAVSQAALDFCKANGMEVIPGFCPYMFLPDSGFVHKFHGFTKKLTGSYPK